MYKTYASLALAAMLALVACQDSSSGKALNVDVNAQWDALHKPGNRWSIEENEMLYAYEVVKVEGDTATLKLTQTHGTMLLEKDKSIVVVKPQMVQDRWRDPALGYVERYPGQNKGRGEEKIGVWDCYFIEYEVTASGSEKFYDKVWRHKKYGIVVQYTQNGGKPAQLLRELNME